MPQQMKRFCYNTTSLFSSFSFLHLQVRHETCILPDRYMLAKPDNCGNFYVVPDEFINLFSTVPE